MLLSHHRRRKLLNCLQSNGCSLSLPDAAEEVAVREFNKALEEIAAKDVKQVYMSLYHAHVPKLADHGVVKYDQEQDRVALTDKADALTQHMESPPEEISD